MQHVDRYNKRLVHLYRSLLPSTSPDQESETVDPFSRADVLYNQSVDKIAALFDADKYEGIVQNVTSTLLHEVK